MDALDIQFPKPTYFSVGTIGAGSTTKQENSWKLTLTRKGAAAGYGDYTIVYTDQGFDSSSTIISDISPMQSGGTSS